MTVKNIVSRNKLEAETLDSTVAYLRERFAFANG
jgi:hypothetical protein